MARGNNQTIPSGTGILTKTLSGDVRQSITVLNPNDGILYVVQNSTANATTWDFVIPSQSYGALPGPWESIGLYYVDQSGAGRPGNVTVFESDNRLELPLFQAIGIARLSQVTTVDIVEGIVPGAPGAGIARLWADTNNFLHILTPGGTDYTVADTGTVLGGALSGSLPNPTLNDGTVTAAKIVAGAVDNTKLAGGAAAANINAGPDGSIGGTKIGNPTQLGGILQVTGTAASPANGSGAEMYGGTTGVFQAYNRNTGAWIDAYLQGLNVRLVTQGGKIITSGAHFDQAYVDDWIRPTINGQGIYNNAAGQGMAIDGSGLSDYVSGRRLAKLPIGAGDIGSGAVSSYAQLVDGAISAMAINQAAPGGSTTSTTYVAMPVPFNSMSFNVVGGRRWIAWGLLNLIGISSGAGLSVGFGLDGGALTVIVSDNVNPPSGGYREVPFVIGGSTSGWGAGNHTLNLQWAINTGSVAVRTDVYSWCIVTEVRA